jgi:hypothetical protein
MLTVQVWLKIIVKIVTNSLKWLKGRGVCSEMVLAVSGVVGTGCYYPQSMDFMCR